MLKLQLKTLAVGLVVLVTASEAQDILETTDPGSAFATQVEELLASTKQTSYQHTTSIDEEDGVVRCDCSGLVGYLLRQQFPESYISLRGDEAPSRKRPLAVTYYETFVAAGQNPEQCGCWQQIKKLTDVVPGDVIAWRKPTIKPGSTTGHVLIVAGLPEVVRKGILRLRIIDSTRNSQQQGLGTRFITFTVNEEGEPTGYLVGKKRVSLITAAGRIVEITSSVVIAIDAEFVGKTLPQATELAKERKVQWRVIRDKSVPKKVGWKIDNERLNFIVENNRVVKVLRG